MLVLSLMLISCRVKVELTFKSLNVYQLSVISEKSL